MKPDTISTENVKQTIAEFLKERKAITDCIYDLDRLNEQRTHDEEFMMQLQDVIMRAKNKQDYV
jgi:hypothetical protein